VTTLIPKFLGYHRPDNRIGIRNYVAIVPTVGCANEVVRKIAESVKNAIPFLHHEGCTQLAPDIEAVTQTLISLGKNPNFGAVLVVSLGCEGVNADRVAEEISNIGKPVEKIVIQELGTLRSLQEGIRIASTLMRHISSEEKDWYTLGDLVLGVKCGASDATSGIASNPAVGYAVDTIIEGGGTVVFGETTEIIGAEHLLAKRIPDPAVKEKILFMINRIEERAKSMGVDMRTGQPTPGNIAGGLTTIEEKSLGAIAKTGSHNISGALEFWESPRGKGLFMKDTPGREIEAMTGLSAAGVQLIAFTTGRGAPQGFPGIPVIKISANPQTSVRMEDNIDLDVSDIITKGISIKEKGEEILNFILKVANGQLTKSETIKYDETMDIYTTGPVI